MYCKKCGEEISGNEKFCNRCGSIINTFNFKKIFIVFFVSVLVIFSFIGGSLMMNNDTPEKRSIALDATAETNKNSSSNSSSISSQSETAPTLTSSEPIKKVFETISSDDLYRYDVKTDKILGTFKFLKDSTLPAGFSEINKDNVFVEFKGHEDTSQKLSNINIDITIRNISNTNLMMTPSKLFIYSSSTNNKIYSEVSIPFNLAIEPSCSVVIPSIFTDVSDQSLVGGWSLLYDTVMNGLVIVPEGSEGFTNTLKMSIPSTNESTESQPRTATAVETSELNEFFLNTGGTQDQVDQITWKIWDGSFGRFSADAMHSGVQKRIRTVGYDPEMGYMTKAEYLALTD